MNLSMRMQGQITRTDLDRHQVSEHLHRSTFQLAKAKSIRHGDASRLEGACRSEALWVQIDRRRHGMIPWYGT